MTEVDVETIAQRTRGRSAGQIARITSDKGLQLLTHGFKVFVGGFGFGYGHISPCSPRPNGEKDRFFQILKGAAIWSQSPLSLHGASRMVERFVAHCNDIRLHFSIPHRSALEKPAGIVFDAEVCPAEMDALRAPHLAGSG